MTAKRRRGGGEMMARWLKQRFPCESANAPRLFEIWPGEALRSHPWIVEPKEETETSPPWHDASSTARLERGPSVKVLQMTRDLATGLQALRASHSVMA